MNIIFIKWWNKGNKVFQIINYKEVWKENGNPPRFKLHTNGAIKSKGHKCLDINIVIGYLVFNYVNFNLQGGK